MIKPFISNSKSFVYWAYAAVLCMFAGLILSRALYSAGLLLMALYWFLNTQPTGLWRRPWFLSMLALPLLVLVADLMHGTAVDGSFFIKLSLPLFPLFFFAWRPGDKEMEVLTLLIMCVLSITALHSIGSFLLNTDQVVDGYKKARVMQVGFYHDHIRISLAMAASVIMALYSFSISSVKWRRVVYLVYAIFMVLFLHILTARTGLLVLYIAIAVLLVFQLWKYHKRKLMAAFTIMILFPVVAYQLIPSFRHRVGFVRYDFGYYSNMEYRPGSSDGFRYYSWLSGWDAFKDQTLAGTGFRQLHEVNRQWFISNFPDIGETEIIQPSSEFLLHAAAAGVVGLLIFCWFAFAPLAVKKLRSNAWFMAIFAGMAATWVFEILPENQYGIFVTGFFLAWAWWLAERNEEILRN